MWSTLVCRHNDPEDDYHNGLHDFLRNHHNEAAFDVFRVILSAHSRLVYAIKAGWAFQLNADVTGKLCRKSVDLLVALPTLPTIPSTTFWLSIARRMTCLLSQTLARSIEQDKSIILAFPGPLNNWSWPCAVCLES
jgi:hypothetical protein